MRDIARPVIVPSLAMKQTSPDSYEVSNLQFVPLPRRRVSNIIVSRVHQVDPNRAEYDVLLLSSVPHEDGLINAFRDEPSGARVQRKAPSPLKSVAMDIVLDAVPGSGRTAKNRHQDEWDHRYAYDGL